MSIASDGWRAGARVIAACGALMLGCGGSGGSTDGGVDGGAPRVSGTLTLPAASADKPYTVKLFTMDGRAMAMPAVEFFGTTGAGTSLPYALATVAGGTYFVLGFVDVDSSGGTSSTPGDYAGWYGHTGNGDPPGQANAVVPASGSVTFDFSLVLR